MTTPPPGSPDLRLDFPTGAGRIFAWIVFPLLALPIVFFFIQALRSPADAPGRTVGLAVCSVVLALIAAGLLLTLRMLHRRPSALVVRANGLELHYGSRVESIDWATVRGIEQVIVGMAPTYAVLLVGRSHCVFGWGDRSLAVAQEIVRRAGLRW